MHLPQQQPVQLTESQLKYLRGLCHALKPVVMTGNHGLSDAVLAEMKNALNFHELIKVKLRTDERSQRAQWIEDIQARFGAVLIQKIGHVACFYRPNPDQSKIALPD